jgi:4'-phosphopantetheinyl transferase
LDLDVSTDVVDELHLVLSGDERRRVARYTSPLQQRRATVRLARRRQTLAGMFAIAPDEVIMRSNAGGRPFALSPAGASLGLSSSHCGGLGLMAVARGQQVGVDVEAASELPESSRFASWVATSLEARQIAALPRSEQSNACLRLWTRKEAYLKATGEGIGAGLQHVQVPLGSEAWGQSFHPLAGGPRWLLYRLACPHADLEAALVASGRGGGEEGLTITITRR